MCALESIYVPAGESLCWPLGHSRKKVVWREENPSSSRCKCVHWWSAENTAEDGITLFSPWPGRWLCGQM